VRRGGGRRGGRRYRSAAAAVRPAQRVTGTVTRPDWPTPVCRRTGAGNLVLLAAFPQAFPRLLVGGVARHQAGGVPPCSVWFLFA